MNNMDQDHTTTTNPGPTPGPWSCTDTHVYARHGDIDEYVALTMGNTFLFSDLPGRAEANARLIAAAPELLLLAREMCHRLFKLHVIDHYRKRLQRIYDDSNDLIPYGTLAGAARAVEAEFGPLVSWVRWGTTLSGSAVIRVVLASMDPNISDKERDMASNISAFVHARFPVVDSVLCLTEGAVAAMQDDDSRLLWRRLGDNEAENGEIG